MDIVEKLTAIFDANGHQKSSSIVGAIQASAGGCLHVRPHIGHQQSSRIVGAVQASTGRSVHLCMLGDAQLPHTHTPCPLQHPPTHPQIKSYLSGSPPIRLGLSENLILGRRDQRMLSSYGSDAGALDTSQGVQVLLPLCSRRSSDSIWLCRYAVILHTCTLPRLWAAPALAPLHLSC